MQPRSIVPGATYLITRRVLRRHMLLRPDAAMTNLIVYALAVSALRYGIRVHALCAMSTHIHLVVTDEHAVLPRFLQFFHRLVALGTKVLRAWDGPVWDHEATSVVRLTTREAVAQKIAYTLANPVAAHLVAHATEWPGAKVLVGDLGRGVLRATRPAVYFDPANPRWPEAVTLELTLPPAVAPEQADDFRHEVALEIAREEHVGADVLGVDRVVATSPYERAKSFEALRACNPTFAAGRGAREALRHAVATVRAFRAAYRAAKEQWCKGVRDVLFPYGTWFMRVHHAVGIAADGALM